MVLLIIGTAGRLRLADGLPAGAGAALIDWLNAISQDPLVILLLINLLLLLLGTFMDMGPMIIITTPIFLPVVAAYGIDPVHFGVIMILNLGIGLNTPPVGAGAVRRLRGRQDHHLGGDALDLAVLRRRASWCWCSSPTCRRSRSGCRGVFR